MPLTLPQLNRQPWLFPCFLINANSTVLPMAESVLNSALELRFLPQMIWVKSSMPFPWQDAFGLSGSQSTASVKLVGGSSLALQFYTYFCLVGVPNPSAPLSNKSSHEHLTPEKRVTRRTREVQSELKYQVFDRRENK